MAKVKVSPFWCEPELKEWLVGYAKERGVSQGVMLEAGIRELRTSAMGGVVDLPEAPRPTPEVHGRRVDPPAQLSEHRRVMMERQRRLNKPKGL
jgi:hypothetical protein